MWLKETRLTICCRRTVFSIKSMTKWFSGFVSMPNESPNDRSPMMSKNRKLHREERFLGESHCPLSRFVWRCSQKVSTWEIIYFSIDLRAFSENPWESTRLLGMSMMRCHNKVGCTSCGHAILYQCTNECYIPYSSRWRGRSLTWPRWHEIRI